MVDDFTLGCLEILKAATMGDVTEVMDFGHADFETLKLGDISKGCYRSRRKVSILPSPKVAITTFKSYEELVELLVSYENGQLPFLEMIKQKLENSTPSSDSATKTHPFTSSSSTPSHWLHPMFSYATYLSKASSWQFAHRQSIHLKLPFNNSETKDWFVASLFLTTNCNAKITSEILSYLYKSIDVRAFWPSSHESVKEFVDCLASEVWPHVCDRLKDAVLRPRFGTFVNFVYRCGIGLAEFEQIEKYLLMVIWGGKEGAVSLGTQMGKVMREILEISAPFYHKGVPC